MKTGLLIAWIAVVFFGLALVDGAFLLYRQFGGSYLAIPEILGFVGVYVVFQGVVNIRRIRKQTPPDKDG